ncbi:hypothetical protein NIES4075_28130 [Tolypothrix sp. NIES-4075]|nr:hypothetical protein NIES4075_28130 [Tolypothrix sp. NIES-4075]
MVAEILSFIFELKTKRYLREATKIALKTRFGNNFTTIKQLESLSQRRGLSWIGQNVNTKIG